MGGGDDAAALRELPAVHELAARLPVAHPIAVAAARRAIDERRVQLRAGEGADGDLAARALVLAIALERGSLRPVLNATGVIVHTNLGRAPLAAEARAAVARVSRGYASLELDLESGARGSRHEHVRELLRELTGAEDAIAVNNGAAAVLLAVSALAGPGREVVVSRGQLVEIGGGFRIPEVVAQSGARLIEIGTTNRTRLRDYEQALAGIAAILRVHPSNFRTVGFTEEVSIEELCALGVPVIDDVGSGVLGHDVPIPALTDEPPARRSVAAGAALVCFSGDKLLGGPQAGLLAGRADAVAAAREHPLARAVRIDKLSLAALAATLALYRDPQRARREIPVLAMLDADAGTLARRAERLREAIGMDACEVMSASGRVGGGALPLLELSGPVVAVTGWDGLPGALARALRAGDPPVIGRVRDGRLLLDPRTLADDEVEPAAATVRAALALLGGP